MIANAQMPVNHVIVALLSMKGSSRAFSKQQGPPPPTTSNCKSSLVASQLQKIEESAHSQSKSTLTILNRKNSDNLNTYKLDSLPGATSLSNQQKVNRA